MPARRRPLRAALFAVPIALALAVSSTLTATARPMPDFPSWQDVQAAKASVAATQAEIAKIQAILTQLQGESAALAKVAQQKAELSNQAKDALDAATAKVARLDAQAKQAAERADTSAVRAAGIIAQMARTGGGDLTLNLLFGSGSNTDELLSRLGTMNQVSKSSTALLARAIFDRNNAQAMGGEAEAAQGRRAELATGAQQAFADAQKASDDAVAKVAAQKTASDQMYAQLATLKNTSATIEQQYQDGLAWEALQNQAPNPPVAPPINPNPPAPVGSAVGGAIAFAQAQLGDPYVFGGAGPNAWDCSGLTKMSYAAVGVYIGTHSATNQYDTMAAQGRLVTISQLQAGDLLFYSDGGSTGGSKYHTTLYLGGGMMIEAAYPGTTVRVKPVRYGDLVPYAGRPT